MQVVGALKCKVFEEKELLAKVQNRLLFKLDV